MASTREEWTRYATAPSGVELLHARYTRHVYDRHAHDAYAIGVTETGVQTFTCRGVHHASTAGRVMVFNPDELHDGGPADADGFVYRMLYLPPALVGEIVADAADGRPSPQPFARESVIRDPALARLVVATHAAHVAPDAGRLARDGLLDRLVLAFATRHGGGAVRGSAAAGPALARVRALLEDDLASDLSGDDLARVAGMSRFHLSRAFHAAYGLPPHAWRLQRRLAEAKRLLAAGEGAAQVAAAVGFVDQSHLIRRFKGTFGITPAQFARAAAG